MSFLFVAAVIVAVIDGIFSAIAQRGRRVGFRRW
jgi:hypothetical protein